MVEKDKDNSDRKIVIPGETIVSGDDYLPGDSTYRDGDDVVAGRYGLADISEKLVRVIPLSGVYTPRRGNAIIGEVVDIIHNGWLIDFGGSNNAFLSLTEVPKYVDKNELREHFDFGEVVFAKVWNVGGRGIDLSIKMRGFGKLNGGQIMNINPHKVPRVIGKEGSMVSLIKEATKCDITVGQNGLIWIKGDKIEDELKTGKIIEFICDNSFIHGLTEKVENFIKSLEKGKKGE